MSSENDERTDCARNSNQGTQLEEPPVKTKVVAKPKAPPRQLQNRPATLPELVELEIDAQNGNPIRHPDKLEGLSRVIGALRPSTTDETSKYGPKRGDDHPMACRDRIMVIALNQAEFDLMTCVTKSFINRDRGTGELAEFIRLAALSVANTYERMCELIGEHRLSVAEDGNGIDLADRCKFILSRGRRVPGSASEPLDTNATSSGTSAADLSAIVAELATLPADDLGSILTAFQVVSETQAVRTGASRPAWRRELSRLGGWASQFRGCDGAPNDDIMGTVLGVAHRIGQLNEDEKAWLFKSLADLEGLPYYEESGDGKAVISDAE